MARKHTTIGLWILLGIVAILSVSFFLTLRTIETPRALLDQNANPSPHGYTWSLSLFVVPVMVLAPWLTRRKESRIQSKAFWITVAIISCSGILLDVFFAGSFFTFPNKDAVSGIYVYGLSLGEGWKRTIPIEEFGFYIFGAWAVLLVYVWGDEFWFGAYNVDDAPRRNTRLRDVFSLHLGSIVFGIAIFLLGLFYKKLVPHPYQSGFPGYFLFLTLVALTPSILFFPVASPFINWRAVSLGLLFILLVSLFWEATIAVPYQWWGFQKEQMLGMFINGFSSLPVEEPVLWMGVTWAAVITYETISTILFMDWSKIQADHPHGSGTVK